MKKLLTILMVLCGLMMFGQQAHALSISPADAGLIVATGNETSQAQIDAIIASYLNGATELYKSNFGGSEEGSLASSYETVFIPADSDPYGATITYMGGPYIDDPQFLLVKDGNAEPAWYLFDITNVWDGTETLELSGFWQNVRGSISHVTLYGTTAVPEPAALILLGLGLLGIAGIRKMKR